MAKIDYTATVTKLMSRLKRSKECLNLFALSQGIRALRDTDPALDEMMKNHGTKFVGRYNGYCEQKWLRSDIEYAYKVAVR